MQPFLQRSGWTKRQARWDIYSWLSPYMGDDRVAQALLPFDKLYPQDNGESALQQLHVQLANALPHDLEEMELSEYKNLAPRWHDWNVVKATCAHITTVVFDRICDLENARPDDDYR